MWLENCSRWLPAPALELQAAGQIPHPGRNEGKHPAVIADHAGSGNGCELEIASAFDPVYDAERFGAR